MTSRSPALFLLAFYGIASGLIGLSLVFYPFNAWSIVSGIFLFGLYGASLATFWFDPSCPIDDNCPFKDRMRRGYWEEKK